MMLQVISKSFFWRETLITKEQVQQTDDIFGKGTKPILQHYVTEDSALLNGAGSDWGRCLWYGEMV